MDKIKAALQALNDLIETHQPVMHIPAKDTDTDVVIHDALAEASVWRSRVIRMWKESRLPIPIVCEILDCTYDELVARYGQPVTEITSARTLSQK